MHVPFWAHIGGILVVRRKRGRPRGSLFVTGRDLEERQWSLLWDADRCLWRVADEPKDEEPEAAISASRQKILAALAAATECLSPMQLAEKLAMPLEAARKLLQRMAHDGQVSLEARGQYRLRFDDNSSPAAS